MEVARGVHALSGGVVNFYLVEEGGRYTLVDAGTPKDLPLLMAAVGSLDAVDAVLLTHAHGDHTGFAEEIRGDAGIGVRVHQIDAEVARTGKIADREGRVWSYLVRAEAYRTLVSLARRGGTRIVPIEEVSTFADGETLDVPGSPRVVHMPGHTGGASALYFEDRGVVCTGDSLVTRNPLTGRDGPQIMPTYLNVSSAQALESLARLEDLPAMTVLPGHGGPWRDGARDAVRRARDAGPS